MAESDKKVLNLTYSISPMPVRIVSIPLLRVWLALATFAALCVFSIISAVHLVTERRRPAETPAPPAVVAAPVASAPRVEAERSPLPAATDPRPSAFWQALASQPPLPSSAAAERVAASVTLTLGNVDLSAHERELRLRFTLNATPVVSKSQEPYRGRISVTARFLDTAGRSVMVPARGAEDYSMRAYVARRFTVESPLGAASLAGLTVSVAGATGASERFEVDPTGKIR